MVQHIHVAYILHATLGGMQPPSPKTITVPVWASPEVYTSLTAVNPILLAPKTPIGAQNANSTREY